MRKEYDNIWGKLQAQQRTADHYLSLSVAISSKFGDLRKQTLPRLVLEDLKDSGALEIVMPFDDLYKMFMHCVQPTIDAKTFRLSISDNGLVNAITWGRDSDTLDHTFTTTVDALPEWMKRKLATLMLFDPNKRNEEVADVGRRINDDTFWIYASDGEDYGNDSREESKEPSP
jgi:hypothetical protein